MKRAFVTLALISFVACSPPPAPESEPPAPANGAEAAVQAIYAAAAAHIGRETTPRDAIPMTDDLKALLARAEAEARARGEPFMDGDLALNCQDCVSLSALAIGPQTGAYIEPPSAPGHIWVEARFMLNRDEPRAMLYDMVETPEGWRVDNILAEGFDLRGEAEAYLAEPPAPAP